MKPVVLAALAAALASPAPGLAAGQATTLAATIAAMPKGIERGRGPSLDSSIAAARAAVAACAAGGHRVCALVVDAQGQTVVLLSGDGAGYRSQLIARTKANTVVKYRQASMAVAVRAEKDAVLKAEIAADPDIGMARGGGVPIMVDGVFLGAFAVSGAFGPDEECVDAAMARVDFR